MQLFLSVRRMLRFHSEVSHFVLIYPVSKCFWFVFIRELKVCFCFVFVLVPVKEIIRSSKKTRKQTLQKCSMKIKPQCHLPCTMKEVWNLGIKRESWDFRSPGLCCQSLTASLQGHLGLPNQKTKPFVLCDLNFTQSIRRFCDGI